MVNVRGKGRAGLMNQLKVSLDVDAGEGFLKVEERLLGGVLGRGTRSDVMRLLLLSFEEAKPDIAWLRRYWRRPLGEGWPESQAAAADAAPRGSAPLEGGGGV